MDRPRFGSLSVGARVLWRQIRAVPAAVITIFVATLLTALFVTAVPRVLERVSADDLRESLLEAAPERRNLRGETHGRLGPGSDDDPFSHVRARGENIFEDGFPAAVRSVVADSQYLVESARFQVSSFPDDVEGPFPTYFRFRFQEGIEDEITLAAGDLPKEHLPIQMLVGESCPDDPLAVEGFEPDPDVACQIVDIPVFEAALTAGTAEAMEVGIGDYVFITPDALDRLWPFGSLGAGERWVLFISGIIELSDLSNEFWFADAALHRPRIEENPDFRLVFGTGLMAPGAYREMHTFFAQRDSDHQPGAAEFAYTWRYFVDPDLVDAAEAATLRAELDKILPPNEESVVTLLPSLLTEYLERRALTVRLMSTAVASLAATAVGVILVLAALVADRQAGATVLIRDRGASPGQLTLTSVYTGLLLVVPAALIGFLITAALLEGTGGLAPGRGSAALAAGGTAAVVVASSPYIFRRLGALRRLGMPLPARSGRRVVLEGFVLVAAAASVALLRRRGMGDAPESTELDPLLAMAPAVVGVAAGIVALRLIAPLMRGLSWLAAKGRALVAFIGLRRLVAMPSAGWTPTLVIIVAVAVSVFASVVRQSIAVGQEIHTWQVVGADFRVDAHGPGVPLPQAVDPETLAAGMPWAEVALLLDVEVLGTDRATDVSLLAVDVTAYREVVSAAGVEPDRLQALAAGLDEGPLPVLVSSHWGAEDAPSVADELGLEMGTFDPTVTVVGVVDRFPSLPVGAPFVIVDLPALRRSAGDRAVPATSFYLRLAESETERLATTLEGMDSLAQLTSRHDVEDDLAGNPLALWVDRGLAVVFYLGITFAAVAAVSLLGLTAARRRRDLGFLRTLGLQPKQATAITALEQIPPVVLATLAGAATGAVVAGLLAPALDIGSFTGGLLPAEMVVDPVSIVVAAGLILAVLGVAVATFVTVTRVEDYGRLLKVGDD